MEFIGASVTVVTSAPRRFHMGGALDEEVGHRADAAHITTTRLAG